MPLERFLTLIFFLYMMIFHFSHTKLVLGSQRVRDTRRSTAELVFSCDPEDVLFPLDKFGDREAVALQCGGDGYPANFIVLVVFLLQNVVEDLTATVVFGRFPVAHN